MISLELKAGGLSNDSITHWIKSYETCSAFPDRDEFIYRKEVFFVCSFKTFISTGKKIKICVPSSLQLIPPTIINNLRRYLYITLLTDNNLIITFAGGKVPKPQTYKTFEILCDLHD